jgi:hypothetical protein
MLRGVRRERELVQAGADGHPSVNAEDGTGPARADVPWRWVAGAAVVAAVVLYATLWRYGYHRDELYFRMLPVRWGYVDQPFLTPLLAKVSIALFGDTVVGLRVFGPLFLAGGIVIAALTTRELGGTTRAQAYAAWGYGFASLPLLSAHYLVTGTVDLTLWAAALLAVTRALLRDPRWWLAAGAIFGVAADNKLLVAILVIALLVGLLALGPRSALLSRYLAAGVLIALVLGSPTLIYQATHHFPQVTMARALNHHNGAKVRAQVIPYQALLVGPPLFVVAVIGFVALFRRREWRPVRGLALAYLVALAINFGAGGQIYYAFGLLAYLVAAGWAAARRPRWLPRWLPAAAVALNAVVSAFIALPIVPASDSGVQAALNSTIGDQVGWPTYVASLRSVYAGLSPAEQAQAVVYAGNYGEAGAVKRYGRDLPPVYSAHNELYYEGPPPEDRSIVLVWTESFSDTSTRFVDCRRAATLDNGLGVHNEEQRAVIAVCHLPTGGWAALWPQLQHYD